jgi:predicted transglutaminase-like cysteine proteinase
MSGWNVPGRARLRLFMCLMAFASIAIGALASALPAAAEPSRALRRDETAMVPPVAPPIAAGQFFTIAEVLAKHDAAAGSDKARIKLASLTPSALGSSPDDRGSDILASRSSEPFGLSTFRAPEGILWSKWRKVQSDMLFDQGIVDLCRTDLEHCHFDAALRFLDILLEARDKPRQSATQIVNRLINRTITYVSDYRQHGVADLWSSALASLATRQGDCEDYAIAKYVALRSLGVEATDLRLLLVRDRAVGQDHAVLAVRDEGRWFILDNRRSVLLEAKDVPQFLPLFAINDNGVDLFAASYLASTQRPAEISPAAPGEH